MPPRKHFVWGWGKLPQAGKSDCADAELNPKLIEALNTTSIRSVAAGPEQTAVVTHAGEIYVWGLGAEETEIADGVPAKLVEAKSMLARKFKRVIALSHKSISHVACSRSQLLAVSSLGVTYQWNFSQPESKGPVTNESKDDDRQLATRPVCAPKVMSCLQQHLVCRIACGEGFTVAVTTAGHVYSWGMDQHGRLGHGRETKHQEDEPRRVEALCEHVVSHISCGWSHVAAVLADTGEVYTWGNGGSGRLGHGDEADCYEPRKVEQVTDQPLIYAACGYHHTLCLDVHGRIYAWGGNDKGQLGVGDRDARLTPVQVSIRADDSHTGGDGAAAEGGAAGAALPAHQDHETHVVAVQCGAFHTAAVTAVGELHTWGWGKYGQLGLGDADTRCSPQVVDALSGMDVSLVACGGQYTIAVTDHFMSVHRNYFSGDENEDDADRPISPSFAVEDPTSRVPKVFEEVGGDGKGADDADASKRLVLQRKDSSRGLVGEGHAPPRNVTQQPPQQVVKPKASRRSIFQMVKEALSPESSSPAAAPSRDGSPGPLRVTIANPKASIGMRGRASDASKHKRQLQRMNRLYRDKLQREAKRKSLKRQKDLKKRDQADRDEKQRMEQNLKREQRLDDAADFWLQDVAPKWGNKRTMRKATNMIHSSGIPPRVRGKIWPLALGNRLGVTPELYHKFGEQARRAREARAKRLARMSQRGTSEDVDQPEQDEALEIAGNELTYTHIEVDLTRTFPSLAFFQNECPMNEQLRNVLETYCFYCPEVGYVQGMSYLAGTFLLYMADYPAFMCLANMLNSDFFKVFLKLDPSEMQSRYDLFDSLFKSQAPDLYRHFTNEGLRPDLYFMEWCMTLFCKRLALDVVGRVWDGFLLAGEGFVYRTAVAVLKALKHKLINQPFEVCLKVLSHEAQEITENELFDALASIKLSSSFKSELSALSKS